MPIYEYYCLKCNTRFEQLRPINRAGEGINCPSCNTLAKRTPTTFSARTARGDRGPSGSVIMRGIGNNRLKSQDSAKPASDSD